MEGSAFAAAVEHPADTVKLKLVRLPIMTSTKQEIQPVLAPHKRETSSTSPRPFAACDAAATAAWHRRSPRSANRQRPSPPARPGRRTSHTPPPLLQLHRPCWRRRPRCRRAGLSDLSLDNNALGTAPPPSPPTARGRRRRGAHPPLPLPARPAAPSRARTWEATLRPLRGFPAAWRRAAERALRAAAHRLSPKPLSGSSQRPAS